MFILTIFYSEKQDRNAFAQDFGSKVNTGSTEISPEIEWEIILGGPELDCAHSVEQTFDDGYIAVGYTRSIGAGFHDFWLLKFDSDGNKEWEQTYGGPDYDFAETVQQTLDGGYIVAGHTQSFGAGNYDIWIIKTDSQGEIEWEKIYGTTDVEIVFSVLQTFDGGYIFAGYVHLHETGCSGMLLLKTDSKGNQEWEKIYGASNCANAYSIQQTSDGGYIAAGDIHLSEERCYDFWLVKTDSYGNIEWDKTFRRF